MRAPTATPTPPLLLRLARRPRPSLMVLAADGHGVHGGAHGHGHGHSGNAAAPTKTTVAAGKAGAASSVPANAPPSPASFEHGAPPSLFGMLSSLWPVGGAASKQQELEQSQRRQAVLVKPLASRLELEAELEACEAPGAPPLVVIMSTSWCGPCKLLAEDLQEAAERRPGALRVLKLDVEQEEGGLKEFASNLKVQKLPTVFWCGGGGKGKAAVRTTGLLKRKILDDLIDNRSAFLGTDLDKAVTC